MASRPDVPDDHRSWVLASPHASPSSARTQHPDTSATDTDAEARSHRATRGARPADPIVAMIIVAVLSAILIDVAGTDWARPPAQAISNYMDSGPSLLGVAPYVFLGAIPVTLLHELGHALAARRLLNAPVSVTIGSFGELAQLRLGQISLAINALSSPAGMQGSAEFAAADAHARDILLIAL